jgi:hypothetical protein
MGYMAVMRCPVCNSTDTKVSVTPGSAIRGGEPYTCKSMWTCAVCKRAFEAPSNRHIDTPILMCDGCVRPTPHKMIGVIEARMILPGRDAARVKDDAADSRRVKLFLENYQCACGRTRAFGVSHFR